MKPPLRLLYLTYQENILASGILHTQVVRMLECMHKCNQTANIALLSFMSPQLLWRERKGFRILKKRLTDSNIKLITLPMLIPASWKWTAHVFISLWTLPVIFLALIYRINIIHPRGYAAGAIGLIASGLLRIPMLFDPRGPYPEETVMNGIWKKNDATFNFVKRIEERLIQKANAVIGVTVEYRDEFKKRGAKLAFFIPNRADTKRFREAYEAYWASSTTEFNPSPQIDPLPKTVTPDNPLPQIDPLRQVLTPDATCELLFTGELHAVWNDPGLVARHFNSLSKLYPNARLRLITHANTKQALKILQEHGIDSTQVKFQSGTPEQMPSLLQGATLGLTFLIGDKLSIWPVKIAEYIAAGIPLIVDPSIVGLPKEIIIKYKLGFVADPERIEDYSIIEDILRNRQEWSDRCISYAKRRLDISSTSKQHLRIYRRLIARPQ
ncbi:MAG: glycosyltransferase [Candidatus Hatepunaea meridiana]|nr:glycosyltransferase [Candidatus Hatepunaea meridiana]